MKSISLWDLPTRLFHWLLVLCVTGSLVSVNLGGTWMLWHERFGLAAVGLLSFRLAWGVVGSTYARFYNFVPGPASILAQRRVAMLGAQPVGRAIRIRYAWVARVSSGYRAICYRCHCV